MNTIPKTTSDITLRLADPHALVERPVGVLVEGCEPLADVVIEASIDSGDCTYVSRARFHSDAQGRVDTAVHESHAGTYTGVDPFGLWWSGECVGAAHPAPALAPVVARMCAESSAGVGRAVVERPWVAPGVTLTRVDAPGVQGLLALPAGEGPFPGIVAFGGSGGGLGPVGGWVALLASRGFAGLAISYFGAPNVPPDLVGIEVEVVERAIDWLLQRPRVEGRIGVMGISRGSELAMLAGALLDRVDAVVAFAPSGVVWSGLDQRGPVDAPAWTFRGQPLPYAMTSGLSGRLDPRAPFALRPLFDEALENQAMIESAEIPVERLRGPLLLVSGGADAMWPSTPMAEMVERRAEHFRSRQPVVHLRYPHAGHVGSGPPGTPLVTTARHALTGGFYDFGGTRAANANARADSWPRVIEFLENALG